MTRKCQIHGKRYTHEQKFGDCTFWTKVCSECLKNHHWHLTRKIRSTERRNTDG